MLGNSRNPMAMMQQMLGNNSQFNRAMQMANGKTPQEIEIVMQNLCKEKGIDFEQFKSTFNQFGFK